MEKKFITTSIAYANAAPHIGFAQELLAADVVARTWRQRNAAVLFSTGTDEHGGKIFRRAEELSISPQGLVAEVSQKFKKLARDLNISEHRFVRTTDTDHIKAVQHFWQVCQKDIYKKQYEGLYCTGCEAFVKKSQLQDGKCPAHECAPEKLEEENYFFALSKYQDQILARIKKNPQFIIPISRRNEVISFIEKEGLEDISVSRPKEKLSWGIPVPGDANQVIYVWFDALINYLTVVGYPDESFGRFWPADLQIVGKDIARFHTCVWPAMLLSAGLPLPKQIGVHGHIAVEGKKMSKSLGNVVEHKELIEKFGVDGARYILLRLSFLSDSDFVWGWAESTYRAELADNLGNLLQRTLVLGQKLEISPAEIVIASRDNRLGSLIEKLEFSRALEALQKDLQKLNQEIDQKKPWEKELGAKEFTLRVLQNLGQVAYDLEPFLPQTAEGIRQQLKTLEPEPIFPKR